MFSSSHENRITITSVTVVNTNQALQLLRFFRWLAVSARLSAASGVFSPQLLDARMKRFPTYACPQRWRRILGRLRRHFLAWRQSARITKKHVFTPGVKEACRQNKSSSRRSWWRTSFSRPGLLFRGRPVINHPSLFPSMSQRFHFKLRTRLLARRHPGFFSRRGFTDGTAVKLRPWQAAFSISTCAGTGLWACLNYLIWHEKCNWRLFRLFYWKSCGWICCIDSYYCSLSCAGTYWCLSTPWWDFFWGGGRGKF